MGQPPAARARSQGPWRGISASPPRYGLLYRAVGLNLLRWGGDPDSEFAALRACDFSQTDFADPELKSEAAGGIASRISVYPSVRTALVERQRNFADQPGGAVLDGRDIGTVIAPRCKLQIVRHRRPRNPRPPPL
jgi:cytidylate kinase